MTVARSWMVVAVTVGTLTAGCSDGPGVDVGAAEEAPKYALNGTYTVENLAAFSQDNLGVRVVALDHRDLTKEVFFSVGEPVSIDACADLIVQSMTDQGLPSGRHGDLILVERTEEPRVRTSRSVRSETAEPSEHETHINKVDDWSYTIDRAYVATELTDLDAIRRQGRIVPHVDSNGDFNGYRIYGIRRRSMGHALGIRNGDVLNSVDGNPMVSMQAAMDAYLTLQDADQFTLEVTRRGQRHTISYAVQ